MYLYHCFHVHAPQAIAHLFQLQLEQLVERVGRSSLWRLRIALFRFIWARGRCHRRGCTPQVRFCRYLARNIAGGGGVAHGS